MTTAADRALAVMADLNRTRHKPNLYLAAECVDYAAKAGAFRSRRAAEKAKRRIMAGAWARARESEAVP